MQILIQTSCLSLSLFLSPLSTVKCIRDTPAYFAERLHKAMKVRLPFPALIKRGVEGESGGGGHGCEYSHAALNEVARDDVLTGSRNHGQDPHPHHGVPLWGGHAGHQTGLCEDLWEITLHSHLSKLMSLTVWRADVGPFEPDVTSLMFHC